MVHSLNTSWSLLALVASEKLSIDACSDKGCERRCCIPVFALSSAHCDCDENDERAVDDDDSDDSESRRAVV